MISYLTGKVLDYIFIEEILSFQCNKMRLFEIILRLRCTQGRMFRFRAPDRLLRNDEVTERTMNIK